MDAITATTELEAVNAMLRAISESPVESLDEGNADVQVAVALLREKSRSIQGIGWWFNSETMTLAVDGSTQVPVPSNALKVTIAPEHRYRNLILRAGKIYDKQNNTFTISSPVNADVVLGLAWDDLPDAARERILAEAGLEFVNTQMGAEPNITFTNGRVSRAHYALLQEEVDMRKPNAIFDSFHGQSVMRREI